MTKDETRMTNQTRNPNDEKLARVPFGLPVSDFIRHSGFDIRI